MPGRASSRVPEIHRTVLLDASDRNTHSSSSLEFVRGRWQRFASIEGRGETRKPHAARHRGPRVAPSHERSLASVPSWWQAPLSDEAPEAFVIETVNLGSEREFLFLSGFLIFVWSALAGLRRDKQC